MGGSGSSAARAFSALVLVSPFAGVACASDPGSARVTDAQPPAEPALPDALEPAPPRPVERLPARIRRLSNAEIAASLVALLPGAAVPDAFAPDTRQSGFTANAAQRVDPLYADQLQEAFHATATAAAPGLVAALGCQDGDACAARFIADFVTRAWRRPLDADERADLLEVFHAGTTNAAFTDGVALVVEAALQAAGFLYVTELGGPPTRAGETLLAPHEIASALSFLVTGGPPDGALMAAATGAGLAGAAGREAQARRLLASEGAQHQVQRFVKEWLGLDLLAVTSKDNDVYPDFEGFRPYMVAETDAYIAEVVFHDTGTLGRLLTADYTIAPFALARYYGLATDAPPGGRTSLGRSPRRGLLTQPSFLAVHAHPDSSAPVKRGAAVLERLLCMPLPRPSDVGLTVLPPRPDPTRTTRARYEAHAHDPTCSVCHALIDPIGFAFEAFDGMGQARTEENGQPVQTTGELAAGNLSGHVDGAAALVGKLAALPEVEACLARNFFRFAAAQTDERLEDAYLAEVWTRLPADRRASIMDLFVAWAASDMFVARAVSP